MNRSESTADNPAAPISRLAIGGLLMGIANLIPGLSGGTMILAMGLYTEFIDSVADVTALRFTRRRIIFLGVVGGFAAAAIIGLAGVILYLLFHYTVTMYALFIGMTLGGAPLLARMVRPVRADVVVAVVVGVAFMAGVAKIQTGGAMPHNTGMDVVSGVVGSTTMVLPGISGSYMLLVTDQYDRVVGTVDDLKAAAKDRDLGALRRAMWIAVPVGIGVLIGIVALSNGLKYLLHRHERKTLGFLLGMLLGSVIGLWPFGRLPSDDALERRSDRELVQYAHRMAIPVSEGDDRDSIIAAIVAHQPSGALGDQSASAVAMACLAVAGGFVLTRTLASRGEPSGGPASAAADPSCSPVA